MLVVLGLVVAHGFSLVASSLGHGVRGLNLPCIRDRSLILRIETESPALKADS